MVKPTMVTKIDPLSPVPQMSTTSWLGWLPPLESQLVRLLAGLAGPTTVTEPFAVRVTDWVMASCSVYVPAHTLMMAPDGAAVSAAEMLEYPGEAQLTLLPSVTEFDTHSVAGMTAGAALRVVAR